MADDYHELKADKGKSNISIWHVVTLVLAIVLVISIFTNGFGITGKVTGKSGELTADQAKSKAVAYLEGLLHGQTTVAVSEVKDVGDLYYLKLDVGGQIYDAYMTKNGGLLFPTSINLSQPVPKQEEPAQTVIPKTDKPNVKFFVMSFCPYGQQAENGLGPVYGSLKDSVVMEPHYVIYSNYAGGGPNYCMDNESKYCSMHGVQELHEDVRQLCVYKNYNMSTWWNYISKINAQCSYGNVDSCWESAANASGVDVQKIQTCFNTEGLTLLANELSLNAKFGVQESPQVFINDVEYQGGRAPANFQSAICSAFNTEPSGCSDQLNGTAGAAAGSCS